SISQDTAAGTITYIDENGDPTVLDIAAIIAQHETLTSATFDPTTGILTYNDEDGVATDLDLGAMIPNFETVTTLVDNGDGTYTYTSEDGTVTTVDVPADIVNQFEDIVNSGPVTVNGNTYNSIEEYLEYMVTANETVTTLVDNGDGTYTYTSEDGTVTTVDVPADIVNQFEDIVNSGPVTVNGNTYNSIEEYLEYMVTANETVTTLVDNGDGMYTYTSEDGTVTTVDVPADIVNQFEDIVNSGPVTVNGNTYNSIEEYLEYMVTANSSDDQQLSFDSGTNILTLEDGGTVDLSGLVNTDDQQITDFSLDGTTNVLTLTLEDGGTQSVDLSGYVGIDTNTTNISLTEDGTDLILTDSDGGEVKIALADLAAQINTDDQQITDFSLDGTTNVLTLTIEDGGTQMVNLSGLSSNPSVVTPVTTAGVTAGLTPQTIATHDDGAGTTENIQETVTTFNDLDNDGIFTYTSEDGITTDIAGKEPWYNQDAVGTQATQNTQNIYQMGNVGIGTDDMLGTTNPDVKLAVNGSILTTNSIYADYVFEDYFDGYSVINKDYSFKSLKEVETFINNNRHLPGITNIDSLAKNEKGEYQINISELSVQVLEKVEELYLHTIDQQKLIESKDKEIEQLKKKQEEMESRMNRLESLMLQNSDTKK
ncbi:hypothetical protein POV26_01360, partial [Aequorivita todarodis]|uniref:hypothetical protein n=1 Tax=Aequorivita todarodis TaxID=2036821 RepID=UPI002350744D